MSIPKPPEGWIAKTVTISGESINLVWHIYAESSKVPGRTMFPGQIIDRCIQHTLAGWEPSMDLDSLPSVIIEDSPFDSQEEEDPEYEYSDEELSDLLIRSRKVINNHFYENPRTFIGMVKSISGDKNLWASNSQWQKWEKAKTFPPEYAQAIESILTVMELLPVSKNK